MTDKEKIIAKIKLFHVTRNISLACDIADELYEMLDKEKNDD